MAEYVELIDKYLVTRGDSGTPSYRWMDNTGEIVRCKDCKWRKEWHPQLELPCDEITVNDDFYCAFGEK